MKKFLVLFLFVTAFLKLEAEIPDTVWTRSISEGCYYAQFSSTGDTIMNTAGGKIQFRETATGNLIREWVGLDGTEIKSAYWSKSGKWVAVCGFVNSIKLFNLKTDEAKTIKLQNITDETVWVHNVIISPDERHFVAAVDVSKPNLSSTRAIRVWDLWNDSLIFYREVDGVEMRYSDDGKYFVFPVNITGDLHNPKFLIKLFDANNYKYIADIGVIEQAQDWITDIKFNSDCSLMATSAEDGTVKIWDVEKRSLVNMISTPNIRVLCVSFYGNTVNLIVGNENIPTITSINVFDYKQNIKIYPYNLLEYGWIKNLDFLKGRTLFQAGSGIGLLTNFNKLDVSTNDINIDSIIYPNPNSGELKVKISKQAIGSMNYILLSPDGSIAKQGNYICDDPTCEIVINVSSLASGTYFLKIGGKFYKLIIAK